MYFSQDTLQKLHLWHNKRKLSSNFKISFKKCNSHRLGSLWAYAFRGHGLNSYCYTVVSQ